VWKGSEWITQRISLQSFDGERDASPQLLKKNFPMEIFPVEIYLMGFFTSSWRNSINILNINVSEGFFPIWVFSALENELYSILGDGGGGVRRFGIKSGEYIRTRKLKKLP
jgi:hypothetical protein